MGRRGEEGGRKRCFLPGLILISGKLDLLFLSLDFLRYGILCYVIRLYSGFGEGKFNLGILKDDGSVDGWMDEWING